MKTVSLVLFFTQGVSLSAWDRLGAFERETALYRGLQKHGVRISFVTYGDAGDLQYADRIPGIRILCNRWDLPPVHYVRWLALLHGWHLWRADVFKSNQIKGADVAARDARRFRKPLIARCGYVWSRQAVTQGGETGEALTRVKATEQNLFSAAERVVVTTEQMREYALREYALPGNKVKVIPNYVLTDHFRPKREKNYDLRRICFVGRLEREKNLLALLEAVRGLDVELLIIGTGSQRAALDAQVRRNGLNVRFVDNRPHHELPQHLNTSGIFILPSRYEGHPKTLLEAMACGRPVIGTNVPGIRETIRHRETGYLCGTGPEEIRAAIEDVMRDAVLRQRMGEQGREYVLKHFSLQRVLPMELKLLRQLVNRE